MYQLYFKWLLDLIVATMVFVLLLPVFLVVVLGLAVANKGKPFFLQPRPGRHGRIFCLIKFKTMNDQKDPDGNLLPDAERITPLGGLVRKTSLDELPQLINVIKGDMSLIGPRPLLVAYLPLYNEVQKRRHEVRPGITGLAQISGRNNLPWQKRFELDVWYVDNCSLSLDLKIIGLTFVKVFKSEGVNQEGQATVQYFTGNQP